MNKILRHISQNLFCFILIFLCFSLTSAGWISCNYHLLSLTSPEPADFVSMIAGYALQAAGIGLFAAFRTRIRLTPALFSGLLALYLLFLIPAFLSTYPIASIVFGLLSNLLCGCIAEVYLRALARRAEKGRRGLVFGGAYAASTIAVWLLSLIGKHSFLASEKVLIVYILIAAATGALVYFYNKPQTDGASSSPQSGIAPKSDSVPVPNAGGPNAVSFPFRKLLFLSAAIIVLFSLVKNIGFSFPTADIVSGVNMELSRIFYGSGLLIAGIINDKSRRTGAICTLSALILPFISLALSGHPVPGMIFWALDYFFFGFFSVFRVLFFADLAEDTALFHLAALGLLFGRAGDVLGTLVNILLSNHLIVLILTASGLFILSVFLFFQLYLRIYTPAAAPKPSEQESFEQFILSYELSARESEVLRLVLAEKTNAEIAEALFVSESTVKFHIHNILKKTGSRNRSELKAFYKSRLLD